MQSPGDTADKFLIRFCGPGHKELLRMHGIDHYCVFLITGILLNITPGPDTIYILSRSIAQGRKAGILSVLGISSGGVIHTCLVAFGLSLLILKSIAVFSVIQYSGAAYLIYLGTRTLVQNGGDTAGRTEPEFLAGPAKIYRQGLITNLFNPKVALFFMSFLPQFIDPQAVNNPLPFLLLGATFVTTGTIWCLFLVWSASYISDHLRRNEKFSFLLRKMCGMIFIALGLKLAFEK